MLICIPGLGEDERLLALSLKSFPACCQSNLLKTYFCSISLLRDPPGELLMAYLIKSELLSTTSLHISSCLLDF